MTEPVYKLHPTEARWTHVALRFFNDTATTEIYTSMTPLELLDQREDEMGYGAWLGMSGETNNPFILVLAQFFPETDPFKDAPNAVLAPFAHLGIEMSEQAHVDQIAERAQEAGCLAMPPTMMPPPIGYICMLRDPDGNMVEFSWDQGVWSTLRERWDSAAD
jgi:catechol 2,3-dioxygenase-like lactoylglutathione lyase family enzyme